MIAGDHDPSTPPAASELIAARVPGARLARIAASHLSLVERPAEFTSLVLEFLCEGAAAQGRSCELSQPASVAHAS